MRRILIAAFCAVAATAVSATANATGAPAGTPGLRPTKSFPNGYPEYFNVTPGQTINDSLAVSNTGDAKGNFNIGAVDGFTSPVTGIVYANLQNPFVDGPTGNGEYGAGKWITVSASQAALAPNASTTLFFSVAVPPTTLPGDYVGGISAENPVPNQENSGNFGITFTSRSVVAVVIHVRGTGHLGGASVGNPSVTVENQKRQVLNLPLGYAGDVLTKPLINFVVYDSNHASVASLSRRLDTFVPHSSILFPFPLTTVKLAVGCYSVVGKYGPDHYEVSFDKPFCVSAAQASVPPPNQRGPASAVVTTNTSVSPLLFIPPGIAVVGALLVALLWWLRRRCGHCGRHGVRGALPIKEVSDICGCEQCLGVALRHRTIVLCPACLRDHLRAGTKTQAHVIDLLTVSESVAAEKLNVTEADVRDRLERRQLDGGHLGDPWGWRVDKRALS